MTEALETVTQGTLKTAAGKILPLEHTEVRASIAGPLAEVVVRQRFKNTSPQPIEAVYVFPLPGEASVYRMEFRIADRVVRGVVKEKEEARRVYQQAQREGRAATLLEEDRPSLFTLSIANVAPGAVIDVELEYLEMVAFDDGHFRFVFPMVAPARYREGEAPARSEALPPPRLPSGERGADVAIEVHVEASRPVQQLRCASHPTQAMSLPDGSVKVRLPPDTPLPNRDFVLTWQAGAAGVRPMIRCERRPGEAGTLMMLLTPSMPREAEERHGGAGDAPSVRCGNCGGVITNLADIVSIPGLGHVLPCRFCGAVLAPGTALQTKASRPRDVLVLVDRSASTRGSLPQARRATLALLDGLAEGDCVQVVAFDHDRTPFDGDGSRFVALAPEVKAQIDRFLGALAPRGGTELAEALEHVQKLPAREGRTRVVVLLTDAGVGNEGLLLRRVPELLGASTRLFVLGVGPAVDRRLIARLAQAGGGAHDVILPEEDVEITVTRFARRVREGGPILTSLSVALEGAALEDVHPTPLPDLFGGQPVRLLARFHASGPAKLVINGLTAENKPFRQEVGIVLPSEVGDTPGLGRLWAKHHVDALAARAGREPGQANALRAEATAVALRASLVGPFTSLVAEDSQVSVKPERVRKWRLGVVAGPSVGAGLVLDGAPRTVGRAPASDLYLADQSVSRLHVEVRYVDGGFRLRDVDSANGTTVAGARVREARLALGQRIEIGNTVLVVEAVPDGPAAYFEHVPQQRVDVPMPTAEAEADAELTAGLAPVALSSPKRAAAPMPAAARPGMPAPAMRARSAPIAGPAPAGGGFGAPPPPPGMAPPPPPGFGPPPAPGFAAPAEGGFGPPPPAPAGYAAPPSPPAFAPPPAAAPAPGGFGALHDDEDLATMAGPAFASGAAPAAPMRAEVAEARKGGGGWLSRLFGSKPDPVEVVPLAAPRDAPLPVAPVAAPRVPPPPVPARVVAEPPATPPGAAPIGPCPECGAPRMSTDPFCMICGYLPGAKPVPPPADTSSRVCPMCGGKCLPTDRFCPTCAHALPDAAPVARPAPPPPRPVASQQGPAGVPQAPLTAAGSEPYPEHELLWLKDRLRGELDLVFLVDATASMSSYIEQVRARLLELVDALRASPLCRSLRLGLVTYRDHPPQDHSYVSRVSALTDDIAKIRADVLQMAASGGGDGPEAVTDGLFDVVRLEWRLSAAKAVVWFGDAPPHGVEPSGDGFPKGCPCGHHWYAQAESCREMGIAVYSIGCLPGLRSFVGAEEVFRTVARASRGMFLPLREAKLLVPLIAGAAESELDRQRVDEHVAEVVKANEAALGRTDEAERVRWVTAALRHRGVRARGMAANDQGPAPLKFRDLEAADVEGALWRLRALGRIAV